MDKTYSRFHKQIVEAMPSLSITQLGESMFLYCYQGLHFSIKKRSSTYRDAYDVGIDKGLEKEHIQSKIQTIFQKEYLFINHVLCSVPVEVNSLFRECFEDPEGHFVLLGQPLKLIERLHYLPEFSVSTLPLFQTHLNRWNRSIRNEGAHIIGYIQEDKCCFRRSTGEYSIGEGCNIRFQSSRQLKSYISEIEERYRLVLKTLDGIEEKSEQTKPRKHDEVIVLPDDWYNADEITIHLHFYVAKRSVHLKWLDRPLVKIYPHDVSKTEREMEQIGGRYRSMVNEVRYFKRLHETNQMKA